MDITEFQLYIEMYKITKFELIITIILNTIIILSIVFYDFYNNK
jgi:hypothetical protein